MHPDMTAVSAAFERRVGPGGALSEDADRILRTCQDMALRFRRGGKLIVFGNGGSATDAQHVAVEFAHPVIVGKRAFPAVSLTNDVALVTGIAGTEGLDDVFAGQLRLLASPDDIAMGFGDCPNVLRGLDTARELGLLTVALVGGHEAPLAVDHQLVVRSRDPLVVKEVHMTIYHLLWELAHVFYEQPEAAR
ncbi:phosphoheptose isomerase [Acrocarpospora pleiomorpha]|uniref:Phosphoheptose isomerase n=1 Tax=Acrocarpospora pleiomorpha TaxID=90975 RepID=A0A5M3XFK7_9ACTN|nr:SIS domain-containing protein [Acrocarpospora pleiomorpha]GES20375.1 phosphoheptose isomerase [Acrocarpospora pleiomorpha]